VPLKWMVTEHGNNDCVFPFFFPKGSLSVGKLILPGLDVRDPQPSAGAGATTY